MKTIFIDVETTGLDCYKNSIIEMAAIYEDGEKEEEIFHAYCKPDTLPEAFEVIEQLTGITWDLLEKHGLPENVFYNKFISWLDSLIDKFEKKDKAVFCAYNAAFDNSFVRQLFKRNNNNFFGSYFFPGSLDIMAALELAIRKDKIGIPPSFKNADVAKFLNIEVDEALTHSALYDISLSKKVLEKIERLILN